MNFKLTNLLAIVAMCWGSGSLSASAADYCSSGALTRTDKDRHLASLVLSDGTSSTTVSVNQSAEPGSPTYFDRTSTVMRVQPGATISFPEINWTGGWMHSYAYIDYNGDGTFDTTLNAYGTNSGELVAYSYHSAVTATTGQNSKGGTLGYGTGVSAANMPDFTIPANLAPGDYRLRFKIDWLSLNPCGATVEKDGGSIVDITLQVEAPLEHTIAVKSSDTTMGTVAITGTDQLSITKAGAVEITATPLPGYSFVGWYNDATSTLYSELPTVTITTNDDMSLTARFSNLTYPTMTMTFTNNANQENRYLGRVTTSGTNTPEVFNASSQAELPYVAFTASPGTYVSNGAVIDKTANPIQIEHGTQSFTMTLYAWTNAINGNSSELNWTQFAYFIDWNGNGLFTDSGEISDKSGSSMPQDAILNGVTRTITVPTGTKPGTYRMRIVFYEPSQDSDTWQNKIFSSYDRKIRNGRAYDFAIEVLDEREMQVTEVTATHNVGEYSPGRKNVALAYVTVKTDGSQSPLSVSDIDWGFVSGSDIVENLRWEYSKNSTTSGANFFTVGSSAQMNKELTNGKNNLILVGDLKEGANFGSQVKVSLGSIRIGEDTYPLNAADNNGIVITDVIDYTEGNALWFDAPNSSTAGASIWNTNDYSSTTTNPDQLWERKSFPIGNGSFGGNILGGVNRERVVLNEKTLWKGGPATGASAYWDMNNTVSSSTLQNVRNYLANSSNASAHSLVASNYKGKIDYTKDKFGTYTMMGEAYVSTGINESGVSDYKRIINMDRSLAVVEFKANGTSYQRRYFASYPDSVMVWRFTSEGDAQNLTFSFNTPQTVNSVTSPAAGSLLYNCKLPGNNMAWALRVLVRTNDGGTVVADPSARTITVSGSNDVEFLLAGDTDYIMNFDPDMTDPYAFVGVDPVASVNERIEKAATKTYDELYDAHYADYSELYGRVDLSINPSESFENLPTPTRLSNYRSGSLDHGLEQQYFQYGRYLLISSSRAGTMPANLQGLWHNNIDGPWRVDYHNNINLQMNYWPATCTNLLECFQPFIDYVQGLVKPGEKTAQAYYGARGWTAEVSTNIFGFTAPLNSTDMSWNYNPTAGPWLATQIWEYYDYTRDKEWLRTVGYPIIKSSANFVSDLLYLYNGTYTSAPSYSPEHGTCDLGATYANAVTREVLQEAINAAEILGDNPSELSEWRNKLQNMYPYQVGRYGQLQEWYKDIDTYNDTHRHTNHLFGLHPGTSINALEDADLVAACKETLRQRGDAATGWSMGWKLNHWARLLDGNHAYILFQNLLKDGTADNMWDLHPPFQIDGNFGGTAGVSELFLQSHNGMLHLLPALPDAWTDGHIHGLRTRGNFTVDIEYADGKLDNAIITSNAGEECMVRYNEQVLNFPTVAGESYRVRYDSMNDELRLEDDEVMSVPEIGESAENEVKVAASADRINVEVLGSATGEMTIEVFTATGQLVKSVSTVKNNDRLSTSIAAPAASGVYLVRVDGKSISHTAKVVVK